MPPPALGGPNPAPQPQPLPTPVPNPPPTPTPAPQPAPATGVKFLSIHGGKPGAYADATVQTAPSVNCSISISCRVAGSRPPPDSWTRFRVAMVRPVGRGRSVPIQHLVPAASLLPVPVRAVLPVRSRLVKLYKVPKTRGVIIHLDNLDRELSLLDSAARALQLAARRKYANSASSILEELKQVHTGLLYDDYEELLILLQDLIDWQNSSEGSNSPADTERADKWSKEGISLKSWLDTYYPRDKFGY